MSYTVSTTDGDTTEVPIKRLHGKQVTWLESSSTVFGLATTISSTETGLATTATSAETTSTSSVFGLATTLSSSETITTLDTITTSATTTSETSAGASSITTVTPVDATSIDQSANSSASATQTPSATDTSTSTQLSTASIVGIAIGSVVAAILLLICILLALGFRIQRAPWRRHGARTEAPQPGDEHGTAAPASGRPDGKAELPDAEYTQRLETLQDGAKPELEGTGPWKSVWGVFSTRSPSKSAPRQAAVELGSEPPSFGPHELPGDDVLQPNSEESRDARGAT